MKRQETEIRLVADAALVLFEWLSQHDDTNRLRTVAGATPKYWALNDALCSLERVLVEPFQPDYLEQVAAARKRIVERMGEPIKDER